jgi:hypothetical protein
MSERDEKRRLDAEIDYLCECVSKKPYIASDYSKKRRNLTLKLKGILEEFGFRKAYEILKTRRGFTPSERLLSYSSKTFRRVLDSIVVTVKALRSLTPIEECELKRRILLAVAEVKYGSEEAKRMEEEARRYAGHK